MSGERGRPLRQWVSLPSGSCDLRVGEGLLDEAGAILKGAVGRPHVAALAVDPTVASEHGELLRRQLADGGFVVRDVEIATASPLRTLDAVGALCGRLADLGITADDLVVAVGGANMLALCAAVAGTWLGGVTLAAVPTSVDAAITGVVTPRGISVNALGDAIVVHGCARHALCDLDVMPRGASATALARAQMAATALCESERAVAALWDRADALLAGDAEAFRIQLASAAKGRGQIVSSSSTAVRASAAYGMTFARVLVALAPGLAPALALAEGIRFCARLSAGMGLCDVDDVLAQDELLERLDLGPVTCELDGAELASAIRKERFTRTNRLMLELPRSLGKVRLATVDEGLLYEHAQAWCSARSYAHS